MDKSDQTLGLSNGRQLGFAEYGDLEGIPVFHFNGSGGSRLERPADLTILNDLGIRYISTDRPGHGNSSEQVNRKLLDWPDNVVCIADYLNINKFHVLGWSAGGSFALACAYKYPNRVISGSIVCGLAPANRPNPYEGYSGLFKTMMILGRKYPKLVYFFRNIAAKQVSKPGTKAGDKFVNSLPKVDQKPFENKAVKEMLIADIREGYKQGGNGPAQDDILINSDWGFDLAKINTRIDIWQGDLDKNVPINQAKYQASLLPNNTLHIIKNKGHMLILDEWKNILSELIR